TTRYLLLTGDYLAGFVVTLHLICATPHRRPPRRLRRHAPPDLRDSSPATTSPASSSRLVIGVRVRRVAAWVEQRRDQPDNHHHRGRDEHHDQTRMERLGDQMREERLARKHVGVDAQLLQCT